WRNELRRHTGVTPILAIPVAAGKRRCTEHTPPNQMHTPPARRRAGHPAQTQPCLCSHTDASLPRQGLHA
ncbi:MAG: hypothetical protein WCD86_04300, partial [Ktedonobacteraceae bacterium]